MKDIWLIVLLFNSCFWILSGIYLTYSLAAILLTGNVLQAVYALLLFTFANLLAVIFACANG